MKLPVWIYTSAGCLAAAIMLSPQGAVGRSLEFDSTPATDVVAKIDRTFNAEIIIKPGVNADRDISFTVDNIEQNSARLDAVNSLANSLDADFHKNFVVRQVNDDANASAPSVDTDGIVEFKSNTVSAEEAIRTITGADNATVQFYSPVKGEVTLTSAKLTAREAAEQVAKQTHTHWRAVYMFTPRLRRNNIPAGATIIGYTPAGSPITEMPLRSFDNNRAKAQETKPANNNAAAENRQTANANNQTPVPNQAAVAPQYYAYNPYAYNNGNPYLYNAYPYGYNGYPNPYYNPYYNPYAYAPPAYVFGNGTNNNYFNNGGLTLLPPSGYSNGAPIIIGNGY